MEIRIESLIEGAARAEGAVAIIDVFRAFTTAAVAFANGATHITMVASVEEALALRHQGAGQICMGEVGGRPPERFDFGNSPYLLSQADLRGKAIIQRTSAGTQGIVTAAKTAQHMFAASLVTASATARAMRSVATDRITLVAMGEEGRVRSSEDEICALYLRNLLEGRQGNPEAASRLSSVSPAGSRCHGTVMGHDHQILGQAVLVLDAAGEKRLGAKPEAVGKPLEPPPDR